jgi:hypothetical protein
MVFLSPNKCWDSGSIKSDHFLHNHSQFIIYQSCYHSALCSLAVDSLTKYLSQLMLKNEINYYLSDC